MIKSLFLLLFLYSSLFSLSMFTLDKVQNFKIHFINSAGFLDKDEQVKLTNFAKNKLKKRANFIFNKIDPIVLFIKVKSIEIEDGLYAISVEFYLAEDIVTKRAKDKIPTFAYTYHQSTLMESEDPYEDTLEAIDYLTCQFLTAYKDDNE